MIKELQKRFGHITNLSAKKGVITFDKPLPEGKKVAGSTRLKVSISIDQLSSN